MVKTTLIALIAAAAFAAPAFAVAPPPPEESEIETVFGSGSVEMRTFTADSVLVQLKQKGVNASAVEEWSGLIRAYVTLEDGSQVMQFYKPGSLEQVQR
ncbi:hypothetical protein D9M68_822590 [compost metagenome]